jgi:hypothetical protein
MSKVFLAFLIFCMTVSGCFWSSSKPKPGVEHAKTMSVEVLRSDILAKGGAVLVEPFKAGSDAEATPALDRFALLIVKGAADALDNEGGRLSYKASDGPGNADFVIEGHIDQFRIPGTMDKMMFKKDATVRIKGELKDIQSGEIIALVYDQRKAINDPKGEEMAAYAIGVDMVRELVRQGVRP